MPCSDETAHTVGMRRLTLRGVASTLRGVLHQPRTGTESHGTRASAAPAHHAGSQALLGRPARAEAHAAALPILPSRFLLSARGVSPLPRLGHRMVPGERTRQALLLRDRLSDLQQSLQGQAALRARHDRARGRPAHDVKPRRHPARSEEDPLRHASGGGVREAHRRDHPAPLPARGRCAMKELRNSVCIVGADESDELGTLPHKSQLTLHVEAVRNAVRDAGLKIGDVDGVFTAGQHSPATIGEALGIVPRYVDGTTVGGCSFIIMVGHALLALHHGLCDVAVVCHGESGRSGVGVTPRRDTALPGQYEAPFGFGGAPTYFGMITTRHMHEYGTTLEQWAHVAVSTREWARLNPKAKNREPITVADVLSSRPVCYPFNLLNICLVTDAGGAVVLTRADRAKDCAKKPVYVRGAGEATEHVMVTQMRNLTTSEATRLSGAKAFAMAGVGHGDFDHIMLYDAFTSGPPIMLESLGFCKPGEGVRFFDNGRSTPGGSLPINTNGGGLSYTHSGMYGIFPIIEATRQLRGECGDRQVPRCRVSLVNGMGGMLSAAGTLVLANET